MKRRQPTGSGSLPTLSFRRVTSRRSDCSSTLADKITGSVPPLSLFAELLPDASASTSLLSASFEFGTFSSGRAVSVCLVTNYNNTVCLVVCVLLFLFFHQTWHKNRKRMNKNGCMMKAAVGNWKCALRTRGNSHIPSRLDPELLHWSDRSDSLKRKRLISLRLVMCYVPQSSRTFFFLVNTIFPFFFFSFFFNLSRCWKMHHRLQINIIITPSHLI